MARDLPTGTVTLLFTDVDGSTRLLQELGPEGYAQALADHRRILRDAFDAHGGIEVDTQGDAFFAAFRSAGGALEAAREARDALAGGRIRVRMGLHTGTPHATRDGYVGVDVHRAARIAAAGHGGQIVLSAATASGATATDLRELGEHRLKDFDEPVALFQLGGAEFPPLKTISNTNLPRPASSFLGRERETAEVASLLRDSARLLTLTGAGGSGKTRLALETAAELVAEFKAGVFWVGMAALRDPALVLDTIAHILGAKGDVAQHIGGRELLLLLDNIEQVVEAAPELAALVEACPNLRLLVTSREPLRVRGEVEYQVLPLAEPDGVALFYARAQSEPDASVRELCRALDNLPLAIELAAVRTSALSPRQMLERLAARLDLLTGRRDADPRQQTLRATIEWSYELLREQEKRLFGRLAVFRGGCTLDATEVVAKADLDTLQSLVDKNLLRHSGERFSMLETIRAYATERLEASGEADDTAMGHVRYFLALAEEAEAHLLEYSREWLDRLELEHDNLRAALDRLDAAGEGELVLRLAGALPRFWDEKGHLAEGRRRLEGAVAADDRPTAARAKALDAAADMAVSLGDAATASLRAEEALALHRALGDDAGSVTSRFLLGLAVADQGDFATAQELFEESAREFHELGDEHHALAATRMLAWMWYRLGNRERGRALHEQNLQRARAVGNPHIEASTLGALAMIAVDEGRVDEAASLLRETQRSHRDLGDPLGVAKDVCRVARVLAFSGRAARAARLLASAETRYEDLGAQMRPWLVQMNEATLAAVREQLGEAALAAAWEEGRALEPDAALALAFESLE